VVPPYEFYASVEGRDAFDVLARNGIRADEVVEVLNSRLRLPVPMIADFGARTVAVLGRTTAGRALRVDVRVAAGFRRIIVGASEMTDAELARYEKWVDGDER